MTECDASVQLQSPRVYIRAPSGDTGAMKYALIWIAALICGPMFCAPILAQDLSGLASLDAAHSDISASGDGIDITLALSQPVPWRVRLLDAPPRLILDFREVDWANLPSLPVDAEAIAGLRAGVFRPAWSRLVIALNGPMAVTRSQMSTQDGAAKITLRLDPAAAADFAKLAKIPEPPEWQLPKSADIAPMPPKSGGPLVVVLDPGHGGLDPGAQAGGRDEADLVLSFARELKEALMRSGNFSVTLTREADVFIPLESRISIARAAGADVFLSLHADAVAAGDAVGATVYTLAKTASDKAGQTLAERHDRDDLLAGVDLSAQDDLVARVLMDMARTSTAPRTARLSASLATEISAAGIKMHRHPQQTAGFSVLKSPDIPSVLIELGFLSSARDLANLSDPAWRATMAGALRDGLESWAKGDAVLAARALH